MTATSWLKLTREEEVLMATETNYVHVFACVFYRRARVMCHCWDEFLDLLHKFIHLRPKPSSAVVGQHKEDMHASSDGTCYRFQIYRVHRRDARHQNFLFPVVHMPGLKLRSADALQIHELHINTSGKVTETTFYVTLQWLSLVCVGKRVWGDKQRWVWSTTNYWDKHAASAPPSNRHPTAYLLSDVVQLRCRTQHIIALHNARHVICERNGSPIKHLHNVRYSQWHRGLPLLLLSVNDFLFRQLREMTS